ncbi:hypothetical protein QBC32DRAFT_201281 [Pseudoneurospora amorphoporcata]|uniref:NAD(P)-binding protein n=1 Tax=Pseudoneurospora amorphoporcata TaxID=241081 RepID=A0AAN6P3K8_9PEZI|nr:hypothetical protein QBC32DRAFT_201281 [Pseudoneurospora amorphoporcata]
MATTAPDSKTIVLITGANRGISFEIAKNLSTSPEKPYHIILSGRHLSSVESAITTLRALPNLHSSTTLEPLPLDLTSDTSISSAASHMSSQHGRLDILVHNAAISSSWLPTHVTDPHAPSRERVNWRSIFDTDLIGPALLTGELVPLLSASPNRERNIVFVSSGLGSIPYQVNSRNLDLSNVTRHYTEYRASKAALNMYAKHLAWKLGHADEEGGEKGGEKGEKEMESHATWLVLGIQTKTELNNYRGKQEPWEAAAETVMRVVEEEEGETGTCRDIFH